MTDKVNRARRIRRKAKKAGKTLTGGNKMKNMPRKPAKPTTKNKRKGADGKVPAKRKDPLAKAASAGSYGSRARAVSNDINRAMKKMPKRRK